MHLPRAKGLCMTERTNCGVPVYTVCVCMSERRKEMYNWCDHKALDFLILWDVVHILTVVIDHIWLSWCAICVRSWILDYSRTNSHSCQSQSSNSKEFKWKGMNRPDLPAWNNLDTSQQFYWYRSRLTILSWSLPGVYLRDRGTCPLSWGDLQQPKSLCWMEHTGNVYRYCCTWI